MKSSNISPSSCKETMKLLGDYWTLRLIDAVKMGEVRFCEIQRSLDNVNPVTLTSRLKKLENAGLINRTEESVDKISVTYSLTPAGRETLPIIKALDDFTSKVTNS